MQPFLYVWILVVQPMHLALHHPHICYVSLFRHCVCAQRSSWQSRSARWRTAWANTAPISRSGGLTINLCMQNITWAFISHTRLKNIINQSECRKSAIKAIPLCKVYVPRSKGYPGKTKWKVENWFWLGMFRWNKYWLNGGGDMKKTTNGEKGGEEKS